MLSAVRTRTPRCMEIPPRAAGASARSTRTPFRAGYGATPSDVRAAAGSAGPCKRLEHAAVEIGAGDAAAPQLGVREAGQLLVEGGCGIGIGAGGAPGRDVGGKRACLAVRLSVGSDGGFGQLSPPERWPSEREPRGA